MIELGLNFIPGTIDVIDRSLNCVYLRMEGLHGALDKEKEEEDDDKNGRTQEEAMSQHTIPTSQAQRRTEGWRVGTIRGNKGETIVEEQQKEEVQEITQKLEAKNSVEEKPFR